MEAKHTKGPWSAQKLAERWGAFCINGRDGIRIVSCMISSKRTREEKRANAMLISAAPDLLEALTKLGAFIETLPLTGDIAQLVIIKDAAIAKATGDTND